MKLKTLKDIEGIESEESGLEIGYSVDRNKLKQEVIKRVKHLLKIINKVKNVEVIIKNSTVIHSHKELENYLLRWIGEVMAYVEFFNITEEDLNGKKS